MVKHKKTPRRWAGTKGRDLKFKKMVPSKVLWKKQGVHRVGRGTAKAKYRKYLKSPFYSKSRIHHWANKYMRYVGWYD